MVDWKAAGDENPEARAVLDDAMSRLELLGFSREVIPHLLITHGLYTMAATLCGEHLVEDLSLVRDWVSDRIKEEARH